MVLHLAFIGKLPGGLIHCREAIHVICILFRYIMHVAPCAEMAAKAVISNTPVSDYANNIEVNSALAVLRLANQDLLEIFTPLRRGFVPCGRNVRL